MRMNGSFSNLAPTVMRNMLTSRGFIALKPSDVTRTRSEVRLLARTPGYMKTLRRLDVPEAGGLDVADVAQAIEGEFGLIDTLPLGCVARCHLGPPYEVHVLDLVGRIVEHYHASAPLPAPFERARSLALDEAYVTVEVYQDRLVCLRSDGTAVELHR